VNDQGSGRDDRLFLHEHREGGEKGEERSPSCGIGGSVYAFLDASGAAGGNSRLAALRKLLIALGDSEHDASRLWVGHMLRHTAHFLCAVAPMCDVIK
jgi:hypothetical protein